MYSQCMHYVVYAFLSVESTYRYDRYYRYNIGCFWPLTVGILLQVCGIKYPWLREWAFGLYSVITRPCGLSCLLIPIVKQNVKIKYK